MEQWEPRYGFCAINKTDNVALAKALEDVRRRVCAYGGGPTCDCKYGLTVEDKPFNVGEVIRGYNGSEKTGCPELREMIHRLLHRG